MSNIVIFVKIYNSTDDIIKEYKIRKDLYDHVNKLHPYNKTERIFHRDSLGCSIYVYNNDNSTKLIYEGKFYKEKPWWKKLLAK